jgi:hypothetical protein
LLKALIKLADKLRKRPQGVTAKELKRRLALPCGVRTVQRTLRTAGLHYRNRVRKSSVSSSDVEGRLAWAKAHKHFTWRSVRCFADGKYFRFPLAEYGGRKSAKVWVRKGERYEAWASTPRAAMKAPGVHILGTIIKQGHGYVFKATPYKHMCGETCVALLRRLWTASRVPRGSVIQVDGDSAFQCAYTGQWYASRGIAQVRIPPRSPDVAIVEHVWADVSKRLDLACAKSTKWKFGAKKTVGNLRAWQALVLRVCRATAPALLKVLVDSLDRRVAAIVRSAGHPTRH